MNALYDFAMVVEVTCVCGARQASGVTVKAGDEIPALPLPAAWHQVDGKPVCDKHHVDVYRYAR